MGKHDGTVDLANALIEAPCQEPLVKFVLRGHRSRCDVKCKHVHSDYARDVDVWVLLRLFDDRLGFVLYCYYLLPTTYYLLLTTYYLLPTTYYYYSYYYYYYPSL